MTGGTTQQVFLHQVSFFSFSLSSGIQHLQETIEDWRWQWARRTKQTSHKFFATSGVHGLACSSDFVQIFITIYTIYEFLGVF